VADRHTECRQHGAVPPTVQRRSRALLPTKSFFAIVAAVTALLVMVVLSYRSLEAREESALAIQRANAVQYRLQRTLSGVKDAETGQRGYVLTSETRYLEPYEKARASLGAELDELQKSLGGDYRGEVAELRKNVDAKLAELAETIELERAGTHAKALELVRTDRGKIVMDRIRELTDAMMTRERTAATTRGEIWAEAVAWSTRVTYGGAVVLFAMLLLVAFFASRDFRAVEAESWIRRFQIAMSTELQDDHKLDSLGSKVLRSVTTNVDAQVAAIYITEGGELKRIAGHALDAGEPATKKIGEGLTGQAAKDERFVHLTQLPESFLKIGAAIGGSKPREVVIAPAIVDGQLQGVIELGFLHPVDGVEQDAIQRISASVATAIRTAKDRTRLEDLLEETQRQSEELQTQQEELRVTNEELEQQSKTLMLSQTQLENQQSELEQINAQLEEQTQSLERQRDELARAGTDLQRSNEYKSQFLANMSHELRTPLNSSLILAKLLGDNKKGNLDTEQVKFANTIYSAGNDLLTLINDILDLSKIEAGMLDVRPEPIDIAQVASDLRATFQPIASQKQLAFEVKGGTGKIETDATRLQQILRNLISNALKFTERGGVTLAIETTDQVMRFAVSDTGIGIPPDQHELVFEAFRQADGGSNRKFGGTGLGLSISRDLARLLGGSLRVDSAPGRGSTFTLELPLQAPASVPRPIPKPAPRSAPATTSGYPSIEPPARAPFEDDRSKIQPSSRVLLVIEDDIAFAKVMFDLGRELQFLVIVASTAEDGIALARTYPVSAIVLDIGLPDRSGLAVLDSLKRDAKTRHVPVHVVSGSDYTRAALEMGAVGYALKPVARDQLADAIKQLEARFSSGPRRVLIVEDDPTLRESTARLLSGDKVETITAGTSAEALEKLGTQTFDCMVLDISLPDKSGFELLDEMSRGEQYSFPPVIVYTGRQLSTAQVHELEKFSRSIIIKGARSPERLLDEVTLFLHQVESEMPPERQRMLRDARDREAVFEGRKILVVEDDVRNLFALSAVLEPKGAKVDVARNGREALDYLNQHRDVDLVLMDIMMPEMDGLEATRRLRADARFAKLPIIALTAKAMIDDRQKCLDAGANDYIAKPLDVDKLLSLARVWIRR
jgi:signal transduction histidine kinase/CheY-like chemotaxis protein/CHASE3 domain sensor protein